MAAPENHEGQPLAGPLKWRIVELSDLAEYILDKMKPVIDLAAAFRKFGLRFELSVFQVKVLSFTAKVDE